MDRYYWSRPPVRVWREVRGGEKVYQFEGEAAVGKLFNDLVSIERSGVPNGNFFKVATYV